MLKDGHRKSNLGLSLAILSTLVNEITSARKIYRYQKFDCDFKDDKVIVPCAARALLKVHFPKDVSTIISSRPTQFLLLVPYSDLWTMETQIEIS